MSYDTQNIFAKILRDEMPCNKIYEDDKSFAFMDIMPRTVGHVLVIPKVGSRNILDVKPEDLTAVILTAQKLGRAAMKAFDAPGLNIMQFNEPAGGQEVYHLHFHVLPRYEGVALLPPGKMGDQNLLSEHAEKLKAVLAEM